MKAEIKILDGISIRTINGGTHCAVNCVRSCPLMTYDGMTVCSLERLKRLKSRYDKTADAWKRCPTCLRLERKQASKA